MSAQQLIGLALSGLALVGAIVTGARTWQHHLDAVDAMCNRTAQLETLFLKYHPAETQSIFYPGSRSCP